MSWRVIVRFSLNGDGGNSALRNTIASILQTHGIARTATGTWESAALQPVDAAACMAQVVTQLANPGTVTGVNPAAHLDHIWIYIDTA